MKVKLSQVVSYGGHNVNKNGKVSLTFDSMYSELPNVVQMTQLLNENVKVTASVPNSKQKQLGSFLVGSISIHHDGTSRVKFDGIVDFVDVEALNDLPLSISDNPNFAVEYEADIEEDLDEADGDGDDEWGDDDDWGDE